MKQKRKVLSLLLVAIMFIVNVIPALAEVKPLMISELGVINLENGKDAEMNFEVENITAQAQKAYLITALYDEKTNEMMHYNYLIKTIEGKSKEQWGACLPIPAEGDYKVKVFAWEDMQNLKLVSNVLEVGGSIKPQQPYEKVLVETGNYLAKQTPSVLQSIGGEWSVLGLARAGAKVSDNYYEDYYGKVVEAVKKEASKSRPFGGKITEVQRLAMALTAMGMDATNVAGVDLVDYTWNKAKYFSGLPVAHQELGGRQGLNELVFGLITVDLAQFSQPADATITRDQIIHKILTEYRTADGGFSLMKGASKADVDMTAMALQALAPYYETKSEVKKAVDEALETLSKLQLQEGGFTGGVAGESSATSESTSQVVVALTALGIDPTADARFIKGGNNPITDLLSYYRGEGQFAHTPSGEANMMATEQCHYALVAYDRLVKGQNRLYDMTDVAIKEPTVKVTFEVDRDSFANGSILTEMGYNANLEEKMEIEVKEGAKVLDVIETASKNFGFPIRLDNGKSYVEAIDNIMQTMDREEFAALCASFGVDAVPAEFNFGGWMYTINGELGQLGVGADTVEPGEHIEFRYSLYYAPGVGGEWVSHDWNLLDAYNELNQLIASVDESKYEGAELETLKEAKKVAIQVRNEIDQEAEGIWIKYLADKKTTVWGPDSPTEALEKAAEQLQMAIDRVPMPKTITVSPSGFIELKMGETMQIEAAISPSTATQEVVYEVVTGNEYVEVSPEGIIKPLVPGSNLSMIRVSSAIKPEVNATIFVNSILPADPTGQVIEITNQDLVTNRFETYYWIKEATYQIGGEEVTFLDNQTIQYGNETDKLRNKCISYEIQAGENNLIDAGEEITIVFDGGIEVPIGSVPGQWNSNFAGVIQTVYQTNIPGLEEVRSENNSRALNQIKFTLPQEAKGTYTLNKGSVYEKANEYSPGIPGIGTEGYFGTLPPIELTVGEGTTPQPVGEVTLAIEKRTIGKGDTLTARKVDLFEGDTAWDVIKREAEEQGIAIEYSESGQYGSIYISSVDGDGEFDYGSGSGWKYSVNGVFPDKGVSLYDLVANDEIRLRYCVTVSSTELNEPLVQLLKQYIDEAKNYNQLGYTEESFKVLVEAIQEAEAMVNDSKYNSTETAVELEVSVVIGKIISAIKGLKIDEGNPLPPSEIPADFANNIGLNKDFLEMQVGQTYQIIARRLDEIVDNPINNSITHPNYHYEVVRGESVTVDSKGEVVAQKLGQSIIAVTYDAVESNGRRYGAISPINTGLFVVEVTEGIDTGIEISLTSKMDGVVKETRSYDTYYFTEGDTIAYSFSVDATNSETIEVKVNGEVITPQGDIYTAPLGNSGNIIEVKATNNKGTETFAQVVDARKVEVIIENKSDPTRHDDIQVGDEVSVKFKGLTPPVYKLATIYNPSFYDPWAQIGIKEEYGTKVAYTNEKLGGTVLGKTTQWDLANNNAIVFTAEEEGVYSFTGGHIDQGWWGEVLGTDKNMSGPDNPNLGAAHHHDKFSQLPDFVVEVNTPQERPVTGVVINKDIPEIEIRTSYQLKATIQPANATNQALVWTSNQPEIVTIEAATGKLQAVAVGEAEITVRVEGTEFTDKVVVTVIPELPATEEEKTELKRNLDWVSAQEAEWYTAQSWSSLQNVVSKAEVIYLDQTVLVAEVDEVTRALKEAIKALVRDFEPGLTVSPDKIYPGDRVTVSIPALVQPEYIGYPMWREMHTVYESNISELGNVRSKDGIDDGSLLQTLTFTIPETTTAGVYTLTNGRVEASSFLPQLGQDHTTFYVGQMPEITIHVSARDEVTMARNIQIEVGISSARYENKVEPIIGVKQHYLFSPLTSYVRNQ